jgi:hypothetical protein
MMRPFASSNFSFTFAGSNPAFEYPPNLAGAVFEYASM